MLVAENGILIRGSVGAPC